eukprot:3809519-Amphidinium_carterae.1
MSSYNFSKGVVNGLTALYVSGFGENEGGVGNPSVAPPVCGVGLGDTSLLFFPFPAPGLGEERSVVFPLRLCCITLPAPFAGEVSAFCGCERLMAGGGELFGRSSTPMR